MFSLCVNYVGSFTFYLEFGIIYKLPLLILLARLESYYTTSARDFALNVRRHLVLSVGRR